MNAMLHQMSPTRLVTHFEGIAKAKSLGFDNARFARQSGFDVLAAKLSEEHKWLTPRDLDLARITTKEQAVPFIDWASELQEQQRHYNQSRWQQ